MHCRQVIIGGVRIDCLSEEEIAELMVRDCGPVRWASRAPRLVFDANGQSLSLNATNGEYRSALEQADIVHADGQPLVIASRFIKDGTIPERTATTDLIIRLSLEAEGKNIRFFLFGGTEDINRMAARELSKRFPKLEVCGRRNGYFNRDELETICREISSTRPDIVWVGLGKPLEQLFCIENATRISARWLITCGGCFNFLVGDYRRAPRIMQRLGLEWLHRAVFNPTRNLVWRYVVTVPHAVWLIATRSRSLGTRKLT